MTTVSSGHRTSNLSATSGNPVIVLDGGTAVSATVFAGGSETVSSGGTDSGSLVQSGGELTVLAGSAVSSIDDGGTLVLSSGGSGTGLVVSSGYTVISSGATATATVVDARGELVVSGGTAFGTRLSGGSLTTYAGSAISTTVASGGDDLVFYSGAVDNAATIEAGGAQSVEEYGSAIAAKVEAGGSQTVAYSAVASRTVVQSGGLQVISGGSAFSTTVDGGGTILVLNGGTASDTTVNSGGIEVLLSGADSENATIESGGILVVLPGASSTIASGSASAPPGVVSVGAAGVTISAHSATGVTISAYTSMYVLSGGEAISTQITGDNAAEVVFAGGSSIDDTISGYGIQTLAGGTASSAALTEGTQNVDSGGSAVATSMGSGADLYVYAGGFASSASVGSRGLLTVTSGGTALETQVTSAGNVIDYGHAVSTTLISGGAELVVGADGSLASDTAATVVAGGVQSLFSGGVAFSADVQSGGSQTMSAGGVASGTQVQSGGAQFASAGGSAVSTSIDAGGLLTVSSGGSAFSATVGGSGALAVSAGGTATDTTVEAGGIELVLSGGSAAGVTLESGGELVLLPGGSATGVSGGAAITPDVVLDAPDRISTWAVSANAITVNSGATFYVFSGGEVAGTVISGGAEVVAAGGHDVGATLSGYSASLTVAGSASSETLVGGAALIVQSGGVATSVTVVSRGTIDISSATGDGLMLSGGEVNVDQGGTVNDTSAAAFGEVTVSGGVAFGTQIGLFGGLGVYDGGSAIGVTLGLLSFMTVGSGGTASGVLLSGNLSELILEAGATVEGAITIQPQTQGEIVIDGSVMPSAVISGFGGADAIDLGDIAYDSTGSATYNAGTLTVSEGGQSYALQLAPAAAFASGSFALAPDGNSGTNIVFVGPSSHIIASGASGTFAIAGGDVLLVSSGGTSISGSLSGAGPFMTYQADPTDGGTLLFNSVSEAQALETNTGIDSATHVGFGGNMINQGTVIAANVTSGGVLFNTLGTTENVVVGSDGIVLDEGSGTVASGTTIEGGLEGLAGGATTVGVVVDSGGEQVIGGKVEIGGTTLPLLSGTTSFTSVNAGGTQFVNDFGIADSTQIDGGGMVVNSGGTAYAAAIGAAGTLALNSGALASDGISFSGAGGVLDIGGTIMPTTALTGFAIGDRIDLLDIAPGSTPTATIDTTTDVLSINTAGTVDSLQLAGDYSGVSFQATGDDGSGTLLEIPCYAAGTRIATDRGDVPVEALAPGNYVYTQNGRLAPVRWVGRRRVACGRHPRPAEVMPVRIAAGAFGPDLPRRDLFLSPDHAVFVAGVLIPVRYLVNGATVASVQVASIEYVHVELDRHDVLLAEGLPAESYLDTGNRAAFANGGGATALHPDFSRRVWQQAGCADLVLAGPTLAAVRRRLLARAAALGHRTTRHPGLAVEADGCRLAARVEGPRWHVRLPDGAATVTLRSRAWTPAEMQPDSDDSRRLGVAVARLLLDGRQVALNSPALAAGWHAPEADGRWTDGAAGIPVAGVRSLAFDVAMAGRYWRVNAGAATAYRLEASS